jgi:hypothetical protein
MVWPRRYARRVSGHRPSLRHHRTASLCLLGVVLVLTLVGAGAPEMSSAALGGGGALSELTEGGTAATTPTQTNTAATESTSTSKSTTVVILGVGAAIIFLAGIGFVIIRDARRAAPVAEGQLATGGPARDQAARMRQRRAKAKAARRQRKRNR